MSNVIAILSTGAAVLAVLGGGLRYLMALATAIERTGRLAESTAAAMNTHLAQSDAFHSKLADRVSEHTAAVAVLQAQVNAA